MNPCRIIASENGIKKLGLSADDQAFIGEVMALDSLPADLSACDIEGYLIRVSNFTHQPAFQLRKKVEQMWGEKPKTAIDYLKSWKKELESPQTVKPKFVCETISMPKETIMSLLDWIRVIQVAGYLNPVGRLKLAAPLTTRFDPEIVLYFGTRAEIVRSRGILAGQIYDRSVDAVTATESDPKTGEIKIRVYIVTDLFMQAQTDDDRLRAYTFILAHTAHELLGHAGPFLGGILPVEHATGSLSPEVKRAREYLAYHITVRALRQLSEYFYEKGSGDLLRMAEEFLPQAIEEQISRMKLYDNSGK